jgi:hypothetical protein
VFYYFCSGYFIPKKADIMNSIKAFIKKHPVLTYFALTFAISWGGFILVVGPSGFPGTGGQFDTLTPSVASAMLAGPSVAGIMLTGLVSGKAGLRGILSRLLRWRVGVGWHAISILPAPILAAAALFALSLTSPIFTSDNKAGILLAGIAAGFTTVLEDTFRAQTIRVISLRKANKRERIYYENQFFTH